MNCCGVVNQCYDDVVNDACRNLFSSGNFNRGFDANIDVLQVAGIALHFFLHIGFIGHRIADGSSNLLLATS
jgi:hypothetical protein